MAGNNMLNGYICSSAVDVIGEITQEITDYLKTKEHNITERKRIAAALEVATKLIENDTEKFKLYLESEYKDKDRLYTNAEKMIDKGLAENNLEILNAGCNFMMVAFNKNPLENYKSEIDFTNTSAAFLQTDFMKKIGQ